MLEWRDRNKQSIRETHSQFGQIPAARCLKSRHCFLSSVQPANFPAKVIRCSEWRMRLRNKSHIDIINLHEELAKGYDSSWTTWRCLHRLRNRIYLQQSTNEKVEVLHRRNHMCLGKSRRNHGTHVTVLPTRTSLLKLPNILYNKKGNTKIINCVKRNTKTVKITIDLKLLEKKYLKAFNTRNIIYETHNR